MDQQPTQPSEPTFDAEFFKQHLRLMEDSVFACKRAIQVLEQASERDKKDKIVLIHVIDMLNSHIDFKTHLMEEGKNALEQERTTTPTS